MKKQILVIHGGHVSPSHEAFLEYLQNIREISLERLKQKHDWKSNLQRILGEEFDVLTPRMPNAENAQYIEWKLWFERMLPFLQDELILVGHSLGGIFFVKYLSENTFPKKIRALFLVATPHNGKNNKHILSSNFVLGNNLESVSQQVQDIFLYHSQDDDIVPFSCFETYKTKFPDAHFTALKTRGHFNAESLPELVHDIQKLR